MIRAVNPKETKRVWHCGFVFYVPYEIFDIKDCSSRTEQAGAGIFGLSPWSEDISVDVSIVKIAETTRPVHGK